MSGLDSSKPSYSSKNNKAIKKKLSDLLSSKSYAYDASSDSVYKDYTTGYRERSAKAASQTASKASKINSGDTYSSRVSSNSMHRYNARANDLVPQLAEKDFEKYKGNRQNQYNGLNALITKESTEYGRYRDDVAQYEKDRQLALQKAIYEKQQAQATAAAQAKEDAAAQKDAQNAAKTTKTTGTKTSAAGVATASNTAVQNPYSEKDYMPNRQLNTNQTMYYELMNKLNAGENLTTYQREWLDKIRGYESNRPQIDAEKKSREQQAEALRNKLFEDAISPEIYFSTPRMKNGGTGDIDKEINAKTEEINDVDEQIAEEQANSGTLGASRYEEGTPEYAASQRQQKANLEKRDQLEDEREELQQQKVAVRVDNDMKLIQSDPDLQKAIDQIPYYDAETGDGFKSGSGLGGRHYDNMVKKATDDIVKAGYTEEQADRIIDSYIRNANAENAYTNQEKSIEFAQNHPFKASADATIKGIISGPTVLKEAANYAHNSVADPMDYNAYDRNNNQQQLLMIKNNELATVSNDLENKYGKAASFVYDSTMSAIQSAAETKLFGVASPFMMASGAASDAAANAAAKGLPEDQVIETAALYGIAEYAGEKAGLENLKSFEKLGGEWNSEMAFAILKQAANEFSEESITEVMDILSDYVVNEEDSDFNRNISNRIANGEQPKEAFWNTMMDSVIQVVQAGAAGALTGIISGGLEASGRGVYNNSKSILADTHSYFNTAKSAVSNPESVQALIDEGAASSKETTAYKLSQKLQEKVDSGKKVGLFDAARQTAANESAIQAETRETVKAYVGSDDTKASSAIEEAVKTGNITNNEAKSVLSNEKAIEVLSDMSGMELSSNSSVSDVRIAASAAQGAQFNQDDARYASKGITRAEVDMAKTRYAGDGIKPVLSNVEYDGDTYQLGGIRRKNGVFTASIYDGNDIKEVPADAVAYSSPSVGRLMELADRFGDAGASSIINNYDGSVEPDAFVRAFSLYYDAGLTGGDVNDIKATISEIIPEELQMTAYGNGKYDAKMDLRSRETAVAEARRETAKGRNTSKATVTGDVSEDRRKMAEAFADIGKLNVKYSHFTGNDAKANGFIRGNTINVNIDGNDPDIYVLGHEYMHDLKKTAPESFDDYVNTMINGLKKNYGDRFDREYARYRKAYRSIGQKLSDQEIYEEMAADSLQAFWSDPERFQDVVNKDKTFAGKIVDFLNNFVEWLKDQLKYAGLSSDVAKMVSENADMYEDLATKYARMVDLGSTVNMDNSETRYAAKDDFERFLNAVKDGKKTRPYFLMSETVPQRLKDDMNKFLSWKVGDDCDLRLHRERTQHINNRHGENGEADHSISSADDYLEAIDVLENYTDIRVIPFEEYKWENIRNRDNSFGVRFEIKKENPDYTYELIEAVVFRDDKKEKSTVWIVDEYKDTTKKGTSTQEFNASKALNLTSETKLGNNVPLKNISQPAENDNINDEDDEIFEEPVIKMSPEEIAAGAKELVNNSEATVINEDGEIVAEQIGDLTRYNNAAYNNGGRETLIKQLENMVNLPAVDKMKISQKTMDSIIDTMDMIQRISNDMEGEYVDYSAWAEAEVRRNKDGNPTLSVIVPNGEYELNIDFSTVCKKRKALDEVLNELVKRNKYNLVNLDEQGMFEVNRIIKSHGLEIACQCCFVDAKRYRIASWAGSFADMWNDVVGSLATNGESISEFNFSNAEGRSEKHTLADNLTDKQLKALNTTANKYRNGKNTDIKPIVRSMVQLLTSDPESRHYINSGDLVSSAGLEPIKAKLPELAAIINTHQGTAKPKSSYAETQYINQILEDNKFTPEKAWAVGGVRVQSFSDYMGNMFFDYAQLVSELAAKQLPAHAYTKELDFIRIFGKTGIKINMSLVPKVADVSPEMKEFMETVMRTQKGNFRPKPTSRAMRKPEVRALWAEFQRLRDHAGLDDDGNYLWADETFRATDKANRGKDTLELADEWQNKEGYSQNIGTIAIGVSDAHILKMLGDKRIRMVIPYHKSGINHLVAAKGNIDLFKDYTNYQNTGYMKDGKRVKLEKGMEDFDWYGAVNSGMTAKEAADAYLKFCEEHNYVPKFEKFKDHENYYKLLIDFASYDSQGNATPQQAVTMTFPEEKLLRQYISESLEETQITAQKRSSELGGIIQEIEDVLGKKKYSLNMSEDVVDYDDDQNDDTYAADEVAQQTADLLNGFNITETQIQAMYDKYVAKNNSTYSEKEFKDKLSNIAAYLNGNYRKNARTILETLQQISSKTMETAAEADTGFKKENEAVRKYLKDTTFVIDSKQAGNITKAYGSVEALRRQLFGKAKIQTEENYRKAHPGATEKQIRQHNIDSYWTEMSGQFPEWFNPDSNNQIGELVDAVNAIYDKKLDNLAEKYGYGMTSEMARSMANDMLMDLMSAVNPVSSKDAEKFKKLRTLYGEKTKAYKDLLDKRYSERLEKLRSQYEKKSTKVLEAMARQKESFNEREVNRKETAERTKYKNDARKIYDKMNKMLTNPTDSAYIPVDMINGVIDVLQEINFDTGWRNPDGSVTKAYEKLDKIKKSYENLRVGDSDYLSEDKAGGIEYDGRISAIIDDMKEIFEGDKNISALSGSDMKRLVDDLSYIYESIRNATKLIGKEDAKRSYKMGAQIVEDLKNSGRGFSKSDRALLKKIGRTSEYYTMETMSPERVARMMVGYNDKSPLIELTQDLTKGEERMHMISKEIDDILRPVMDGKENAKELKRITGSKAEWLDYGFTDKNGKKVLITPAMRMALFMHLQNNSNVEHIEKGGIKIPDQRLYMDGKISEAYAEGTVVKGITRKTLENISRDMTDWEKDFCRAAQQVFDDYSKKKINETSLALNGYGKARVGHYMPISTDSDFLKKASDMLVRDARIEGNGHLKARQQGASNPIMLEDLTSALSREQNFVSRYAGLAIPLSNYNKVMNVSLFDFNENGERISYTGSVKQSLNQEWGKNGSEYIERMLADLNGGREKSGSDLVSRALAKTRGNMAGAVLTLNPSVTMKQAASYPVAAAVVGYRDLAAGVANARNLKVGELENLINKYTAEYYFRSKGNSTQELGDLQDQNNIYTAIKKVPGLGTVANSIQEVDLLTTRAIWLACENNISRTTSYQKGTDSYYRKVAELYNRVIHETQPNYSVMQRPEILRTTNEVTKAMTMFMTQRLQNGGILMDSAMNLKAKSKAFKANQNEANRKLLAKAKNEFAHAVSSQIISAAVLSAMTAASRALLHKMNPYRDDKDEITAKSFWTQWFSDAASSIAGSFLFGATIYDLIDKVISGEKYYGMSDNLTSSVSDMADAAYDMLKIFKDAGKYEPDELKDKLLKAGLTVAQSASQMTGIPLSNMVNMFNAVKLHAEDAMNGELGSFEAGVERSNKDMGNALYEAMLSGNEADAEKWRSRLEEAGKGDKISGYLKSGLKENEDIIKAAEYQANGNYADYADIVSEYMRKGFDKEDIISAIGSIEDTSEKTEAEETEVSEDLSDVEFDGQEAETVDVPEAKGDGSTKSMYTVDMLKSALDDNDQEAIDAITEDMYNAKFNSSILKGNTEEEADEAANAAVKKAVKQLYADDLADAFESDNGSEVKRITGILEEYGFEAKDFKSMVGGDLKEQYEAAYEAGNTSEIAKLTGLAENAGYDESTISGWSGAKDEYVAAYESGNQAEIAAAEKKAKAAGYSDEQIMKWVGRNKSSDTLDAIDGVIGAAGSGKNYSTDDMVKARDQWISDYLAENPDKDEWGARAAFKSSITSYYEKKYDDMSQEDRNRLDNILRNYFWYGQTKSGRKSTYDMSKWAGKSTGKTEDPEEDKKSKAKYW